MQFLNNTWKKVESLLNNKGVKTVLLDSERAVRKFIYDNIPDNSIVGLGSALSSKALQIREILIEKGNKVYSFWNGNNVPDFDTMEEQPKPDYYITVADSITDEGNIEFKSSKDDAEYPENIIAFANINNIKSKDQVKDNVFGIPNSKTKSKTNVTVAAVSFEVAS